MATQRFASDILTTPELQTLTSDAIKTGSEDRRSRYTSWVNKLTEVLRDVASDASDGSEYGLLLQWQGQRQKQLSQQEYDKLPKWEANAWFQWLSELREQVRCA